eukprot:5367294-Pleurochrysis_carterae.AAC.1
MRAEAQPALRHKAERVALVVFVCGRRAQLLFILEEDDAQLPPIFRRHRQLIEVVGRIVAEE